MTKLIGQEINTNFFRAYMKNTFGESFAHCSLSIEKVFNESKTEQDNLNRFISKDNIRYAEKLDKENIELLQQRFNEVISLLKYFGIPEFGSNNEDDEYIPGIMDFSQYIGGAIRPYRTQREYDLAKEQGLLTNEPYEIETLYDKTKELAGIITRKVTADKDARDLKKGNNNAFLYALDLGKLTVSDIIKINSLVNNNTGLNVGFKRVNNEIMGSNISTCPKELVPTKIQELLYKYNNEWAKELPTYNIGDPEEVKDKYLKAICEREAKFHIEFERIHPFEDGNGRTGRIILNKHLVDNELGPILLTNEMRDIYVSCIKNQDYKTFGNLIYMISSITTPQIFAAYRKVKGIKPDELGLDKKI